MKTVYLAGPIFGCTDEECKGWREQVIRDYSWKYDFLNPMDRDYRGHTDECYVEIVDGDKADIDKSDILFANCSINSAGTSMEVIYAWERGKVVITFGSQSPWVKRHSTIYTSTISEAVAFLKLL